MLEIRQQQMAAFEQSALSQFEDDVVAHLKWFAREHSSAIGDSALRNVVHMGVERSEKYGFTHRGPVRFYIELMVLFGSDFDTDPQHPWAAEVLTSADLPNQTERSDRLYESFLNYEDEVAGPKAENAREALWKTREQRIDDYPSLGPEFDAVALARLESVYPQKFSYLGEPLLRASLSRSRQLAEIHATASSPAVALFFWLSLALGHGFIHDPLYPWIGQTLRNAAIPDVHRRIERVNAKVMTYLDHVVANFEEP